VEMEELELNEFLLEKELSAVLSDYARPRSSPDNGHSFQPLSFLHKSIYIPDVIMAIPSNLQASFINPVIILMKDLNLKP
jgi:hypothetical protein